MSVMFIFIAKLHETTSRNDSHFGGEGAESPKGEGTESSQLCKADRQNLNPDCGIPLPRGTSF